MSEKYETKKFDIYEHNKTCRFVLGDDVSNPLICMGINPSVATDKKDDRTINKLEKIAKHNGYNGIIMLNVSPEVTTNPNNMSDKFQEDWHKENLRHIQYIFSKYSNSKILACFGNNIGRKKYLITMLLDICRLDIKRKWLSLGNLTK